MVSVLHNQRIRRRARRRQRTRPAFRINTNILLRTLLIPLVVVAAFLLRASLHDSRHVISGLVFPEESEIDFALLQYVLPQEELGKGGTELHPEVVEKLSVLRHEVGKGETLSGLASKYRVNLDTIISYNNIKDAHALAAGKVIEIPNKNGLGYVVKRGDTLEKIAARFGVSLNSILDINNLESDIIRPGQRFFIPGARLSASELDRVLGTSFIYPTVGTISSRYGMREDPFTRVRRFHNGIDIANSTGTAITAARSGRVTAIGSNPSFGRYVIIQHSGGYQTWYAHLSKILVNSGQYVNQGRKIAEMGNTGYSTGSHLHFSIFDRNEPVDPLKYLR